MARERVTQPLNFSLPMIQQLIQDMTADPAVMSASWKRTIGQLLQDHITLMKDELSGLEEGMAIGKLTAESKAVADAVLAERERIIALVKEYYAPAGYDSGCDVTGLLKKIRGEA